MNRSRFSILLIIVIATSFSIPSSIAATKPKAAGRSSTAVINTVLNGKGAPSNTLGINGDFYIDTRSLLISGPKKSGKWPVGAGGFRAAPMPAKRPTSELVELAYRQSNPWGRWSATAAWVSVSPGLPVLYGTQPYGSSPWVLSAEWSKSWKSWSFFVRGSLQPGLRPARGSFRVRYAPTWTLKLRQKSG